MKKLVLIGLWGAALALALAGARRGRSGRPRNPVGRPVDQTNTAVTEQGKPFQFFLLLFVTSIPFWLAGGKALPLPIQLPGSALMVFNPLIAAALLTYRQSGAPGVRRLLGRALDNAKVQPKTWYAPALLLMPLIYTLSYALQRLAGQPLPEPHIQFWKAPLYFAAFWITAVGEELGWTDYALAPLQKRWGPVRASLILGIAWGVWHLISDVQSHRPADWITWQRLRSIPLRALIVWLYNRSGNSVSTATLIHASDNLGWALFPNHGSHYDPFVNGLLTWLAAGCAIATGWGRKAAARMAAGPV